MTPEKRLAEDDASEQESKRLKEDTSDASEDAPKITDSEVKTPADSENSESDAADKAQDPDNDNKDEVCFKLFSFGFMAIIELYVILGIYLELFIVFSFEVVSEIGI